MFVCEDCSRVVDFDSLFDKSVDWRRFKRFVARSSTPRKVIKIFMTKIMGRTFTECQIDHLLEELLTTGEIEFDRCNRLLLRF